MPGSQTDDPQKYDHRKYDQMIFKKESISKETAEFNEMVDKIFSTLPHTYTRSPQDVRDEQESEKALWPIKLLDEFQNRVVSTRTLTGTCPRPAPAIPAPCRAGACPGPRVTAPWTR